MSRRNISGLPMPDARYRVDRATRCGDSEVRFETRSMSRSEDARRAHGLRNAATNHLTGEEAKAAERLAADLEESIANHEPYESPASSVYMREQRIRVIGALWKVMAT